MTDFTRVESNGHLWLITTPTHSGGDGRADGRWRCERCGLSVSPSSPAVPCLGPDLGPREGTEVASQLASRSGGNPPVQN